MKPERRTFWEEEMQLSPRNGHERERTRYVSQWSQERRAGLNAVVNEDVAHIDEGS